MSHPSMVGQTIGRARARAIGTALALAVSLCVLVLTAVPAGPAAAQSTPPPSSADHEIWALDQGVDVNRITILDSALEQTDVIDFDTELGRSQEGRAIVDTPHMIDFTSDFAYAFVASTRSGNVTVIRTADREILRVIPTGATAHFAGVTPDDSSAWVANIGAKTLTEITIDTDRERFELGRELDLVADPAYPVDYEGLDRADKPGPVCHRYTADSRFAYVTLGPGEAGGLVVVDLGGPDGQPFIHTAFPVGEVRANCGVALSADGRTMYASYGSPAPAEDGSDQGEWYAFDTATHTLRSTHDSRGADAHGVRVSPDGAELWMLNRASSSLIVVDTATDEVIAEMDDFGTSPDILDFSPDGSLLYVTLRGPNPRSGGSAVHPIAGETPGVAVIDVAARELLATVQPGRDLVDDQGRLRSDYHGIGVRHLPGDPGGTVTRLAGADRVGTALAVAQQAFGDGEADSAVLARAGDHPDALAGTPLAVVLGGPLLLTPTETLPSEVAAELTRLLPSGASVHVLGGPGAVSPEVAQAVTELGFSVQRLAGPTRFETAIAIAERLGDPPVQLITSGLDFADALSAGAAAAQLGGAVLLTTPEAPQAATEAYLAEHPAEERYAVGGPAARAHPEATAITGATRYETAVAVAERLFDESFVVGLARGEEFPDALAGGAHVAALGGPLLLTPGASLHPAVADYICARPSQLAGGFAYGGASVLTGEVLTTLADRLAGRGCTAARPVGAAPTRFAAAPGSDVGVCHLPTA